jgi:enterochelin esterase-like enzyme
MDFVKHVRRRPLIAGLLLVAAVLIVSASASAVVSRSPRRSITAAAAQTRTITCRSPSLGGSLPARVYLPSGYSAGRRYPVVYFLHGLPAGPSSYTANAFVAAALANVGERAIVVAPQGARNNDSDREYLDWSPTENWPQAIADDLTSCIDHRYDTIADRSGRMLVGLSAGGYGAFNIGLRNLQTFAAVESWSGYFVATDPSGHHILDLGSPQANQAATVPRGAVLAGETARWPSLIAFYVGRSDDRFADMNEKFDASLRRSRIAHVFRLYPAGHSPALWQAQAPHWLTMALQYMSGQTHRR